MTTDERSMTFEESCAEIRKLLDKVPPERWVWACKRGDHEELAAYLRDHHEKGTGDALWSVALDEPSVWESGEARTVCLTGNGPNSREHALLLMLVRAVLPELLDRAGQ